MKTITGHLTTTNKAHIKAILKEGKMEGMINRITYYITKEGDLYTVKIIKRDRGLGFIGNPLVTSTYKSTFTL